MTYRHLDLSGFIAIVYNVGLASKICLQKWCRSFILPNLLTFYVLPRLYPSLFALI